MSLAQDAPYRQELFVAQLAVERAAILTQRVFLEKAKGTVSKDDKSPVTIGDFGAQALIIGALRHSFPHDEIVSEEEADTLRANPALRDTVWNFVKSTKLENGADAALGGPIASADDMLNLIDQGRSAGGRVGRVWAIDPIDGTKGFLRGGQYAVCVGLLVDGHVKVGVLGCPNLPVHDDAPLTADIGASQPSQDVLRGVMFSAVDGAGAYSQPLLAGELPSSGLRRPIQMNEIGAADLATASFCESVEAGHSNQSESAQIAQLLGITRPSVRMDSQAKYGSIARGAGDIYLRLPVSATYQEKIWDHAAGDLIVREAGGRVTDTLGRRLDFGHGRTLAENKGVVAAPVGIHDKVLAAVKTVLKLEP